MLNSFRSSSSSYSRSERLPPAYVSIYLRTSYTDVRGYRDQLLFPFSLRIARSHTLSLSLALIRTRVQFVIIVVIVIVISFLLFFFFTKYLINSVISSFFILDSYTRYGDVYPRGAASFDR